MEFTPPKDMSTCSVLSIRESPVTNLLYIFLLCIGQEHERVTIFLDIIPPSMSYSYLPSQIQSDICNEIVDILNKLQLTTIQDLCWENHMGEEVHCNVTLCLTSQKKE